MGCGLRDFVSKTPEVISLTPVSTMQRASALNSLNNSDAAARSTLLTLPGADGGFRQDRMGMQMGAFAL